MCVVPTICLSVQVTSSRHSPGSPSSVLSGLLDDAFTLLGILLPGAQRCWASRLDFSGEPLGDDIERGIGAVQSL